VRDDKVTSETTDHRPLDRLRLDDLPYVLSRKQADDFLKADIIKDGDYVISEPLPTGPQTTDHLGRDAKDFAIEFGEYLANAAERFMVVVNNKLQPAPTALLDDIVRDHWHGLERAIYEFRKRAAGAK